MRLNTQLPEIVAALRKRPASADGSGWRVGSSLKIWRNGAGTTTRPEGRPRLAHPHHALSRQSQYLTRVAWARTGSAEHPDPGSCNGQDDGDDSEEQKDDEIFRTAFITTFYQSGSTIATTPAWDYLCRRGIDPAKLPAELVSLMRWVPNQRGDEGCLLFPFTEELGNLLALHITYITPQGLKSTLLPDRIVNRGPAKWQDTALLRHDTGVGTQYVVAEGLEDFLSLVLAGCPRCAGVGSVGAFGKATLPLNVESVVMARDGDDPLTKHDADQAFHRGIARYLGQKLEVLITPTPIGSDPNDVLRSDGPDRPESPDREGGVHPRPLRPKGLPRGALPAQRRRLGLGAQRGLEAPR